MTRAEAFVLALCIVLIISVLHIVVPQPAPEIRLIGECHGKFYGAMEESDFPAGCAWIEPIHIDVE